MYSLLEKVDFHCHVSLLEGILYKSLFQSTPLQIHHTSMIKHKAWGQWGNMRYVESQSWGHNKFTKKIKPKDVKRCLKISSKLRQAFFPYIYVQSISPTIKQFMYVPKRTGKWIMDQFDLLKTVWSGEQKNQTHSKSWKLIATWSPQVSKQQSVSSKTTLGSGVLVEKPAFVMQSFRSPTTRRKLLHVYRCLLVEIM